MSNEKFKSESYIQFGGLNTRYSPYITNPMEFLALINYDFQAPGALTQRWGSTQYMGQTFPGPINSLYEYSRLEGASFIFTSYSGGIYYGATTGQFQGLSLNFGTLAISTGGSLGTGSDLCFQFADLLWGLVGYPSISTRVNMNGTIIGRDVNSEPSYMGITSLILGGGITYTISGEPQSDNTMSYATLTDFLFMCDGNKFLKFDGTTTTIVGLPPPIIAGLPTACGITNIPSTLAIGFGLTGSYLFYASYVNSRGFEGNIWPVCGVNATEVNSASLGGSFIFGNLGVIIPSGYGIQSINLYSFYGGPGTTLSMGSTSVWAPNYTFFTSVTLASLGITSGGSVDWPSGNTFYILPLGTTVGGQTFMTSNGGALPSTETNSYLPALGLTLIQGTSLTVGPVFTVGANVVQGIQFTNYFPRYLEVFQNRLWLAGFSSTPSTLWFSDSGEPEGYEADFNFEVRTNDADYITAIKAYSTRMFIFKKKSFHILTGDNPNNFFLQEYSSDYGCLNNRCTATFKNLLVFLDRKGVILFDGASLSVLSDKIQDYFDRMNYSAALVTACMVHDKLRNQIILAIPIDGSTQNNLMVVYDYIINGWTTYQGVFPSVLEKMQGYNNTENAFYGDYQGRVNWFGASILGDNGIGMTLYFKTRFNHDLGDSIQKQYRRLYINSNLQGSTLAMPVNFYQDYGSSMVLSTTFVLGAFQDRIDYGISAKSLSFDLYALQPPQRLQIFGFTVEQRLQRRV